ncbi:hypothetical protein NDU88_001227 [Pleurodeles waltl]|uniref:Uncharacterized protein n=1 Tax=Pleurodeles waltl TaxID=8319 RepID=A0AAV7TH70_PLEWA|nr:hypothetical protein NDU88_001227 [Pleurodeles waltl]
MSRRACVDSQTLRYYLRSEGTGTEKVAHSERNETERRSEEERARDTVTELAKSASEKSDNRSKPNSTYRDAEGIEDPVPLTDNAETPSNVPGGTWLLQDAATPELERVT